jgi:3-isopropylmalate/(R)-2-methylmalate dehydratase large subunit
MDRPRTMFEKIWDRHVITTNEAGQSLLFIDRHYCHELSFHAFNMNRAAARPYFRHTRSLHTHDRVV